MQRDKIVDKAYSSLSPGSPLTNDNESYTDFLIEEEVIAVPVQSFNAVFANPVNDGE